MNPLAGWLLMRDPDDKSSWFADWGAADWTENVEAARLRALEMVDNTARERQWDPQDQYNGDALIASAAAGAETATEFWSNLASSWGTGAGYPVGWDKLYNTFSQAAGAASHTASARESGKVTSVLGGGLQGTIDDLNPKKSWIPWAIGGTVLLGLYAWKKLL